MPIAKRGKASDHTRHITQRRLAQKRFFPLRQREPRPALGRLFIIILDIGNISMIAHVKPIVKTLVPSVRLGFIHRS